MSVRASKVMGTLSKAEMGCMQPSNNEGKEKNKAWTLKEFSGSVVEVSE